MSILIKGMEMPKNCDDCDLMTVAGEYGEPTCPFGRIIRCASERHPDCPLVPVPPHGRLIDADALIARIEFEMRHYTVKDEFCEGRVIGWKDVIRAVREYVPTIIPAKEGEG